MGTVLFPFFKKLYSCSFNFFFNLLASEGALIREVNGKLVRIARMPVCVIGERRAPSVGR